MSQDWMFGLDERLASVFTDSEAFLWSPEETVTRWWEPARVVASVKGTRTATFVLDAGVTWAWLRVHHWMADGRWELAPVASRTDALLDGLRRVRCGSKQEILSLAEAWAHGQIDYTGRGGVVVMTMTDWGINGSARRLLDAINT